MKTNDVSEFFISVNDSLRDAMARIDRGAKGIILVVDDQRYLLGTVTDGDIRRTILANISLDTEVRALLERKQASKYPQPITAPANSSAPSLLQLMRQHSVHQIPLLDAQGRVVDLATWNDLAPRKPLSVQAVVMAGGYGTRLRPLTEDLPKPMLPVGNRPLLERIIEQLQQAGIHHVNVTTHYKPEKITEHFGDGHRFGVSINYISETTPLGTAGALGLMPPPQEPLLIVNGDILTGVDFRSMLAHHDEHHAAMTVAVRQYELQVPYGVLECEEAEVRRIREKPTYRFFVNAGIYLIAPSVHQYVPVQQRFDMTDLIEVLIGNGHTVVSFPIVEYWLDIGQHNDYQRAQSDLTDGRLRT